MRSSRRSLSRSKMPLPDLAQSVRLQRIVRSELNQRVERIGPDQDQGVLCLMPKRRCCRPTQKFVLI